ncbi:serine protease inhibitor 77Ba [Dendroctonus ponderosae]
MQFHIFVPIGIVLSIAAPVFLQEKFNIAESINQFSLELLAAVNKEGGENLNVALSPLTVWTLFTVISEGSLDATAEQIDRVLGQPLNKNIVRDAYQRLSGILLQTKSAETQLETSTGLFTRSEFPVKEKFEQVVKQYYDAVVSPVDFKNSAASADIINKYVEQATKNRIPLLVNPADVENAYLFITTTMYFRGEWQTPFNRSATKRDAFYDEKRNKIGEVQMMYQAHPFAYYRNEKIKADAIELPYGFDDTFSMLVLVPRGFQTLTNMLNALTKEPMTEILAELKMKHQMFSDDDTHVYLPKFKLASDFNLDGVLEKMGIRDVFNPQKANLLGMYSHYLYISRVIQKAEIEVDEEGTVASAAAGSTFLNRTPPPVVKANRPFAFFIVHKQSGSIIFAGKISNPNALSK